MVEYKNVNFNKLVGLFIENINIQIENDSTYIHVYDKHKNKTRYILSSSSVRPTPNIKNMLKEKIIFSDIIEMKDSTNNKDYFYALKTKTESLYIHLSSYLVNTKVPALLKISNNLEENKI